MVDADLKDYIDSIPQDKLLEAVRKKLADRRVLRLLGKYLSQGVPESGQNWQPAGPGTPQRAVISPLLANIHLDPLDQQMAGRGWEMIRYADDFLIPCRSQAEAQVALAQVRAWVNEAGLVLHPQKSRIVVASQPEGFNFPSTPSECWKWPREKSVTHFKEGLRDQSYHFPVMSSGCGGARRGEDTAPDQPRRG